MSRRPAVVAFDVIETLASLGLRYPKLGEPALKQLAAAKRSLTRMR